MVNYNAAFRHLASCFKNKRLTHLICPPLGCVRDKVELPGFVDNLKKFQQVTKAKMTIVSYHEEPFRPLRNGLSHDDFKRQLKELIKPLQLLDTSKQSQPQRSDTRDSPLLLDD